MDNRENRLIFFRAFVHVGALFPLLWLLWDILNDQLSVNWIQDITTRTGKSAIVLLVLALAATPMNTLFGFKPALKVRRALGVYAFLYVSLHFLTFIGLDYSFDPVLLYEAVFEKKYALAGFSAGLILLPLAITSTRSWMKRLGKNWKRLHRFVYLAGILAVIHYVWLVKSDIREPLIYASIVILLLILRIPAVRKSIVQMRSQLKGRLRTRYQQIIDPIKTDKTFT